ncbi:DEAD/DEAH box helicase [Deinococcus peraridilitoris]|uniref:DNA/RNA helicase, superfamily II n=1 Tax=Deinococcus peraridilitoris (strain DSM 19664 / LMG 22246 / CIP 109416 / KR-200) TaxID=937777 RepID=L0A2L4_DEIPD|nr:DEAD/DEAH box helicase [Deinococcus peraridilitoris]AFZ68108.1 DNA/RNA helicase, superfamily II [Deinococcus peraridilitoris DSM 19664]
MTTTFADAFSALDLHASLQRAVGELGYAKPTPIQALALPPALQGRDVLGAAQTGSGKTAAFLLPILQRLQGLPRGKTRALVLAPTRELAAQIEESALALAKFTDVRVASVFGGVSMKPQEKAFRGGTDLIIATPGRLLDHFQHPYARLEALEVLVLDEADRMLDMGFLPDIRRVLRHLPARRQTLFFSATMPAPILQLSRELLRDPVMVGAERKAAPAQGVTQSIYPVPEELKTDLLLELLRQPSMESAIVFTRTKHRANRLAEKLIKAGVKAERIHGNRSQAARTEALAGFKSGKYRVLVATDIAARGIDVEALGHVVNFDVPEIPEDYIHRVGRTARAEMTGEALTFVAPQEEGDLKAIERAVGRKLDRVTLPDFDYRARPSERFEVPIGERIAEIRARKSEERARAKAKAERKAAQDPQPGGRGPAGSGAGRAATPSRSSASGPASAAQPAREGGRTGPSRPSRGRGRGGSRSS